MFVQDQSHYIINRILKVKGAGMRVKVTESENQSYNKNINPKILAKLIILIKKYGPEFRE